MILVYKFALVFFLPVWGCDERAGCLSALGRAIALAGVGACAKGRSSNVRKMVAGQSAFARAKQHAAGLARSTTLTTKSRVDHEALSVNGFDQGEDVHVATKKNALATVASVEFLLDILFTWLPRMQLIGLSAATPLVAAKETERAHTRHNEMGILPHDDIKLTKS